MRRKLTWIDGWAVATTLLVLGGFVFTMMLTWTLAAHGQGAAATQPASAPTVAVPVPVGKGWLVANLNWLLPLALWLLANLATVLSRYPKAKGVVAAIRIVLGGLSMFEFRDGKRPGLVLKLPVTPPAPPPDGAPKA